MKSVAVALAMAIAGVLAGPLTTEAFTCPVVIKQAEELIGKAEGKANADNRALIDEARKYLAEAKAHHEQARTKRDHADAVRKAKFAIALAEEALILQSL